MPSFNVFAAAQVYMGVSENLEKRQVPYASLPVTYDILILHLLGFSPRCQGYKRQPHTFALSAAHLFPWQGALRIKAVKTCHWFVRSWSCAAQALSVGSAAGTMQGPHFQEGTQHTHTLSLFASAVPAGLSHMSLQKPRRLAFEDLHFGAMVHILPSRAKLVACPLPSVHAKTSKGLSHLGRSWAAQPGTHTPQHRARELQRTWPAGTYGARPYVSKRAVGSMHTDPSHHTFSS
jgi:hypothetical protein